MPRLLWGDPSGLCWTIKRIKIWSYENKPVALSCDGLMLYFVLMYASVLLQTIKQAIDHNVLIAYSIGISCIVIALVVMLVVRMRKYEAVRLISPLFLSLYVLGSITGIIAIYVAVGSLW